jgi:hypothetical protein
MEMLVGEQKQDGVALLLNPAGRRSLYQPVSEQPKVPDVRETRSEPWALVLARRNVWIGGSEAPGLR